MKMSEKDPNGEAFYGERVPYVISRGDFPGARLWQRALPPEALLGTNQGYAFESKLIRMRALEGLQGESVPFHSSSVNNFSVRNLLYLVSLYLEI